MDDIRVYVDNNPVVLPKGASARLLLRVLNRTDGTVAIKRGDRLWPIKDGDSLENGQEYAIIDR